MSPAAVPPIWPYGFYVLLRLGITAVSIYGLVALGTSRPVDTIPLVIIALLFSPLIPIHLPKAVWAVIDLGVSCTLGTSPPGFAFDAGEALSEHTAPFDALVLMIEGEAEIAISGRANRVKAAEMLRLPANEPHGVRAGTRFKMLLVMIKA